MTPQALIVCPLVGVLVLLLALRSMDRMERRLVLLGFGMHIAGTFALALYSERIFTRGADMIGYLMTGKQIAFVIDTNPIRWGLETIKLALQLDNDLPVEVLLPGTSTGTMSAVSGLLTWMVGDAPSGVCLLISFLAFWGSVALYRAVRWNLEPFEREPALVGILLMPSAVFWTSGVVKEALVVGFMGILCKGLSDLLAHRRLVGLVPLLLGIAGVVISKPYVLVALLIATGGWFYAKRTGRIHFAYKLVVSAAIAGGLVAIARYFPEFSPEKIFESVSRSQSNFSLSTDAGSNIAFGDEGAPTSLGGQLKWAPIGLMNSLARPFLFEVRNAPMLLAASEMTLVVVVALLLFKRHGAARLFVEVRQRPALMFAAFFVLTMGTFVGLATTNLGSLSRYRVPMMPMYAAAILILRARMRRYETASAPGSVGPRIRRHTGIARPRTRQADPSTTRP